PAARQAPDHMAAQHAATPSDRGRSPRRARTGASRGRHARMTLHVTDLAKHYGETPVFEHVSLAIEPGEFVAVVGESGVGKSTLLNGMAALDDWQAGSITHAGIDVGALDAEARALWRRRRVGFVFQAFHVL